MARQLTRTSLPTTRGLASGWTPYARPLLYRLTTSASRATPSIGTDNTSPSRSENPGDPNHLQIFPTLSSFVLGGAAPVVTGTLSSIGVAPFTIDFYASPATDNPAFTEGKCYLGYATVTPDASGNFVASVTMQPGVTVKPGELITATATDDSGVPIPGTTNQYYGNTSQFSNAIAPEQLTASAGGPYAIQEGSSLTLNASASVDPLLANPSAKQPTYSWTINGVANAATGVNPTLTWTQLQGLGITDETAPVPVSVLLDDGYGQTAAANTTLTVTDAPLTANGVTITPVTGELFSGEVAHFTDANPFATVADYASGVTINWGEGNISAGTVVADPNGGFDVLGSNTYQLDGTYTIGVQINDVGGSTASTTSTALVSGQAVGFEVDGPVSATAGMPFTFTVTALDNLGATDLNYDGIVTFTGGGPGASLPANTTFVSANQGVETFMATLISAGNQTITATDTVNPSITGSTTIDVLPGAVDHIGMIASQTSITAGNSIDLTITAYDAYGNIDRAGQATGYQAGGRANQRDNAQAVQGISRLWP
jgi:hypothetical protein